MTAPDLSKLRIDRDAPPVGVSRALKRNAILAGLALAIIAAVALWLRRGSAIPVQTVVATASGGAEGGAAGTSVTANGYVVARTRAAVSAKVPGRPSGRGRAAARKAVRREPASRPTATWWPGPAQRSRPRYLGGWLICE